MNLLIFLAIIAAVAAISIYLNKKDPPKVSVREFDDEDEEEVVEKKEKVRRSEDTTIFTGILDRETNNFFVAGLEHHCTKKNVGFFTGKVFNESDNAYDKKAMAIGSNQAGKIIGYVPSAILTEYRSWCKRQGCRCVGYIFFDGKHLRGRVRAYLPDTDPEKMVQDVEAYIKMAAEHFGWDIDGTEIQI